MTVNRSLSPAHRDLQRLFSRETVFPWTDITYSNSRAGAVFVLLVPSGKSIMVLFVRRQPFLRRHPGEIAFPGGQREPADKSPVDTALREMKEETGIAPGDVDILGLMKSESTVGSDFRVIPVAGLLRSEFPPELDLDKNEILSTFYLNILDPDIEPVWRSFKKNGVEHIYPAYYIDSDTVIWGLTGRILYSLRQILTEKSNP